MKKVLVLSGGGALGIIQLKGLAEIEAITGKKIHELYDMIVGTSVGAITGGILATGVSATDLLRIFYDSVDDIFDKKWYRIPLVTPLYRRKQFIKMFESVVKNRDYKMRDLKTKFMCTSVDRVNTKTEYFKSWKSDDTLFNCILKSFAAPYYFGQLVDNQRKSVWLDGGAGTANLPVDIAFTECVKNGWFNSQEKLNITCVTCGSVNREPSSIVEKVKIFDKLKGHGIVKQLLDFFNPKEGGLARLQSSDEKLYRYGKISKSYENFDFRVIDTTIPEKYNKLDGAEYKNLFLAYGIHMINSVRKHEWFGEEVSSEQLDLFN